MTAIVVDFNNPDKFPETFTDFKKYLEETSGKTVKKIQFKDDEGDYVTITSDLEYTEAFKAATTQGNLDLQILVEAKPDVVKEVQHAANCDACRHKIKGIRYKCANCPDFDLCEVCEAVNLEKSLHDPDHVFLKIYRPIPFGIRHTLPNLYQPKVERNDSQPKSELEARMIKIEEDLKKVQKLMLNKEKLKKEKPLSRRDKRFSLNKRKVEIQDQFGIFKEEKFKIAEKVELHPEIQSVIQLMKPSENQIQPQPEVQLKPVESEIQLKQAEQEIQLKQSQRVFSPWEEQIIVLQSMGFLDRKLNLELLDRYQDINRVVEHLI